MRRILEAHWRTGDISAVYEHPRYDAMVKKIKRHTQPFLILFLDRPNHYAFDEMLLHERINHDDRDRRDDDQRIFDQPGDLLRFRRTRVAYELQRVILYQNRTENELQGL